MIDVPILTPDVRKAALLTSPGTTWLAAARTTREEQLDALGEVLAATTHLHEERP